MPSIDEINESAFYNRQLDLYNMAIVHLRSGGGAITNMTAAGPQPASGGPNAPIGLMMVPPITDQNVLNVMADAMQMAADAIIQKLAEMGFTPSTREGARKARDSRFSFVLAPNVDGMTDPPGTGRTYTAPPQFSVYPHQTTANYPPAPPPPPIPPNPVPPPGPPVEESNPPPPPPTLQEGVPPSEFPESPPIPEVPPETPPDAPAR